MVSLKTRFFGYLHDFTKFKNKLRKNMKESDEFKSFLEILGEIVFFAILGGMTYLSFTNSNILIKFLGIGCGLVLFKEQILEWIKQILFSLTLVKINR